ncbi:MAG: hypothetical protein HYS98_07090 [Deltaproteobacteria bacterium]|nr:hypothetical protein [Deltaproteobacteria bacterium]
MLCLAEVIFLLLSTEILLAAYDSQRNPFQPQISKKKLVVSLLTLELSSFRISSILFGHSALLEAFDQSFIVKKGDLIGVQMAEVISIGDTYIELQLNKKRWKWSI